MAVQTNTTNNLIPAILKTALLSGALDIAGAFVYNFIKGGKNPLGILKFIASGVFGDDAFTTGRLMIVWGLLLHFAVAILVTSIYFLIYPRMKFLSRNIVASGVLYGFAVWLVMNLLVLPVSNTPALPFNLLDIIVGITILVFAVGLPISIFAYRYYSKK